MNRDKGDYLPGAPLWGGRGGRGGRCGRGLTAGGVFHLSKSGRWATPLRHQLIKGVTQHHLCDLLRTTEVYVEMSRRENCIKDKCVSVIKENYQRMRMLNKDVNNSIQMCKQGVQFMFLRPL